MTIIILRVYNSNVQRGSIGEGAGYEKGAITHTHTAFSAFCAIVIMAFSFAGCNIVEEIITSPEIDLLGNGYCEVPQLTIQQLDNLTNIYTNSVYWRVSKGCSVLEMSAFAGMEGFDGAILAEKPGIIFGWDGVPKYFEWRVFKNGEIVGAIVASASKLICRPVAYVLRMVNSYGVLTNFPADTVIIDDDYPNFVFGKIDTNAKCVTEAIDPFAGTNIGVKKEIFTLMKERPDLFYTNVADQLKLLLFTELYPVYSMGWWENIDEQQMIAVSYLGPLAVSSNKFTTLVQDWESGKVVDGFTGIDWNSSTHTQYLWWDWDWIKSYLRWGNSSYNAHYWCGPTAGGIMLSYYGYTNKIRLFTYPVTNFFRHYSQKKTNFIYLYNKVIDIKPFMSSYLDVYMVFSEPWFSDSGPNLISNLYCGVSPEPNNFNVSIYPTSGGYSAPYYLFKYDFQFSTISSMDHFYTRFNFAYNVTIANPNPSLLTNIKYIRGNIEFHKDTYPHENLYYESFFHEFRFIEKVTTNLELNSSDWYLVNTVTNIITNTYDGYYQLGNKMGIQDWNNGGVVETKFKDGVKWACNNAMDFNTTYFNSLSWFINIAYPDIYNWEAFRDAKNCIEKNDVIAIARFWYWNNGTLIDSHWRIGVGYKESEYGKYILITDNSAESKDKSISGRIFINSITNIYCPYIIWENTETMGYDYWFTVYKK